MEKQNQAAAAADQVRDVPMPQEEQIEDQRTRVTNKILKESKEKAFRHYQTRNPKRSSPTWPKNQRT